MLHKYTYICFCFLSRQPPMGRGVLIQEVSRLHTTLTTLGRTPLDKWSARRRDIHLTTYTHPSKKTKLHASDRIFFKLILLFVILWIHVIDDNVHFVLFINRFGLLFAFFPTRSLSFMDCCAHLSGVLFSPPQIFCYFFVLLLFWIMQVISFLVMYCYPSKALK
jgi:hypothetical protein